MMGLPNRLKYDGSKFINRADEVQRVLDKVRRLRQGEPVDWRTVIFRGNLGVGKSWLLQEINHKLRDQADVLALYIDLADLANYEPEDALRAIVQHIHRPVARAIGAEAIEPYETKDLQRLASWLITDVERIQGVLILLLDHVDESDKTLLENLEDHLLAELINLPATLLVLAGRGQQYTWRRPKLRIRSDELDLQPFEASYTQEQLQKQVPHAASEAKKIQELGNGYPLSSYFLGSRLENEADALNQCVDLLLGNHKELRPYLEALCVLRSFDEARMPALLKVYSNEWAKCKWEYADCRDVRKNLVRARLVKWTDKSRGYAIDGALRPLLENHLKLNRPQTWRQLHLEARKLFETWVERYPRAKDRWEAEARYHAACLEL